MTEAERLRARGIPVQLADTSMHMLRFDFDALAEIEDKHGSLTTFLDHLNQAKSRRFGAVRDGMVAGLARDLSAADVRANLAPQDVMTYVVAINEAIDQALPATKNDQGKVAGETSGSPGPSTSAKRSATSESAPEISGA